MHITEQIIDNKFLEKNLTNIFPNIILLDNDLNIKSISNEIAKLLYLQPEDLDGSEFRSILKTSDYHFLDNFKSLISNGYFKGVKIDLMNKYQDPIRVELSGFYLGLLSNSSDDIILSVHDLNKLENYQNLLHNKVNEFNELVYRTYHDLKGPVATIQGLLNLCKHDPSKSSVENSLHLISQSTNLLNNRLKNISSIFDSNCGELFKVDDTDIHSISNSIQKIIENRFFNKNISFKIDCKQIASSYFDKESLINIFINLILALDNGAAIFPTPSINVKFDCVPEIIKISCTTTGFQSNFEKFENILKHNFKFSEIINNEQLMRIYTLHNQILRNNGNVYSEITPDDKWIIKIIIPIN